MLTDNRICVLFTCTENFYGRCPPLCSFQIRRSSAGCHCCLVLLVSIRH